MSTVISVEHLSKAYKLGQIGTGTFAHDLNVWWAKMRGKPNPMLRIGETDHGNREGEEIWALKDINFTVEQGEVLGIIGRNGAGKSTLLKILSRVTAPTEGRIKVKGRVASLLEVGTGFHPDLTGRENIYLNGAILGMNRKEIDRKFDEIVDFAEVEKFIDTPVKRYSSGMYVRLAFAVAAYLEPEILVVDEVLAVGDIEFQKKCLGKMGDAAKEGRTVLFVSHNMGMIRSLCVRSIVLSHGVIQIDTDTENAIQKYLLSANQFIEGGGLRQWDINAPGTDELRLRWIQLLNAENSPAELFDLSKPIRIEIGYEVFAPIRGLRWIVQIKTQEGIVGFSTTDHLRRNGKQLLPGLYRTACLIPANLLNQGKYYIHVHAGIPGVKILVQGQDWLSFSTTGESVHGSFFNDAKWPGVVAPQIEWIDDEAVKNRERNLYNAI